MFPAFSNHCLANAVEPLRAANTLSGRQVYAWQFLSVDGAPVTSSSGLPVAPEAALATQVPGDDLFVMPSYDVRSHATPRLLRGLRAARRRYGRLVGLDTGAWLLAQAGLLDGRRATIHWDAQARFAEAFPEVEMRPSRVVDDGDIVTCGGASTAFDLALHIIGQDHGPGLRLDVADLFMASGVKPDRARRWPRPARGKAEDAIAVMRATLEDPMPVAAVAAAVGLTRKRLAATCKRQFGLTPDALYRGLRLREARRLSAETGLSVEEIARRCGYRNASALTRAFRAAFGDTPTALRGNAG
ncbi:MAG: helix-turn-helix domain-containing protein [Pseudomonadota bacterium]